jgi:benzoyl-CoA reductase subunit D
MITAGIDLGIENVKAVLMQDGRIIALSMTSSGGAGRSKSAEQVWNEALASTKLTPTDVSRVVATGQGKYEVRFANENVIEPLADARAALWFYPSARSVIDIGADQARAARFDARAKSIDPVLNQKCTAGIGIFLKTMSRTLGLTLDEMSRQSSNSHRDVSVNDRCANFAELDALWLLHENTPIPDIVQAVSEALAARLNSMLNEKIVLEKDAVLVGGVARNTSLVNALKNRSGINFLIPEQPEYAGAIGAALIAVG